MSVQTRLHAHDAYMAYAALSLHAQHARMACRHTEAIKATPSGTQRTPDTSNKQPAATSLNVCPHLSRRFLVGMLRRPRPTNNQQLQLEADALVAQGQFPRAIQLYTHVSARGAVMRQRADTRPIMGFPDPA